MDESCPSRPGEPNDEVDVFLRLGICYECGCVGKIFSKPGQ